MGKTEIIAMAGIPQVLVSREFAAPRELIYRAHTDPELLAQWLGPRSLTTTIDHYDLRHGGAWRYISRDSDGAEYAFRGVFHGTPSMEDGIVQTFEFEGAPGHVSLETARFEESNGRTRLRASSAFQSVEDRDAMVESGMEVGINEGFERLDELLARLVSAKAR